MELLSCQKDAYQKEGVCCVLSVTPEGSVWRIEIEDSLLYPEGGGQPPDHGEIAGVAITDVQRSPKGTVLCKALAPVALGDAPIKVDWKRRFDHMQQHSAQHLLTALAEDQMRWPTASFHLGDVVSTIEFQTPFLSDTQAQRLLDLAHDAIRKALPIRSFVAEVSDLSVGSIRSRGLPEGHQGPIRLVSIEGIDLNTCGGTHVASTAEIQAIALVEVEKIRGNCRISYVAGQRLLARGAEQSHREKEIGLLLSCGPSEQIDTLKKLLSDLRSADKSRRDLQDELSLFLASKLAAGSEAIRSLHRPHADLAFLEAIAKTATALAPQALFFFTASPAEKGEGIFLLAGPPEPLRSLGPLVASVLQGRGGGRPGRFQGKAACIEARTDALAKLSGLLTNHASPVE